MTIYRFTAFFVMIVTLVVGLSFPRPDFHITGVTTFEGASAVNFGGFATVFLSGAVALNFHYNVPDIVNPVRNKTILNRIVSGAQLCAFSFCIIQQSNHAHLSKILFCPSWLPHTLATQHNLWSLLIGEHSQLKMVDGEVLLTIALL
jgi:hypothetical protein